MQFSRRKDTIQSKKIYITVQEKIQYSTREYTLQYKKRHNTVQEKKQLGTRKNVVLKCLNNQSIGLLILRKLYIFIKIKIYIFIKLKFRGSFRDISINWSNRSH